MTEAGDLAWDAPELQFSDAEKGIKIRLASAPRRDLTCSGKHEIPHEHANYVWGVTHHNLIESRTLWWVDQHQFWTYSCHWDKTTSAHDLAHLYYGSLIARYYDLPRFYLDGIAYTVRGVNIGTWEELHRRVFALETGTELLGGSRSSGISGDGSLQQQQQQQQHGSSFGSRVGSNRGAVKEEGANGNKGPKELGAASTAEIENKGEQEVDKLTAADDTDGDDDNVFEHCHDIRRVVSESSFDPNYWPGF